MFDRKSDYALNKKDPDAIVCKSVTDVHIRLTRADFASESEFQKWKRWSDGDYWSAENAGRALSDNTLSLETQLDHPLPSVQEWYHNRFPYQMHQLSYCKSRHHLP